MLGRTISDPDGVEGRSGSVAGLGLLDVETVIGGDKTTRSVTGRHVQTSEPVAGYEIHLGRTGGPDCARPFLDLDGRPDGARSADGLVAGTYVHGIFSGDEFRRAFLRGLGGGVTKVSYEAQVEAALDSLADHLEGHVDIDRMLAIASVQATSAAPATTTRKRSVHAPR
jgi:adenosylcobyric acid synthase